MTNRIGIFGGTFDPPHIGHVLAAQYAISMAKLDWLVVIPCRGHRNSKGSTMSPYSKRVEMAHAAFRVLASMSTVSTLEEEIQSKYTIETVERLRKHYHDDTEFVLIVGADNAEHMECWHRWEDLKDMVTLFPIGRDGQCDPEKYPVRMPEVSSTQVRQAIEDNDWALVESVVPPGVLAILKTEG